ncbi:hypothetical protein [Nonomuraea sp. NPDC050786]|uniref:hypothetical protein n=1 Tax=Nonomuraea sp. NPDC050786 TaxID=3154840 RepID=UPI0033F98BB1
MEDVGRLLDTLDEGFAEATGEQPAVPAHDPGTEVIPGTGQYHRPPQQASPPPQQHQPQHQPDDRPTAALSPNDVLVARGAPSAHQDKLVASYSETTAPRDSMPPAYGEPPREAAPAYGEPSRENPAYGERNPFTGPQYVDSTGPQQRYTGDPFSGPQYTGDPFSGPQYTADPPQYAAQPEPFAGPQYSDTGPVYQMPGEQRGPSPLSTDPLGFPSQAAAPHQAAQHRADPFANDPYPSDPYARRPEAYQQPQQVPGAAGLGTPMHGIPGAGRRRSAPQPVRDDYASYQQQSQPNPVDPLLAMGRPEPSQGDPLSRPYVGDPMFSTGERLRPEQQPDYHERSDRREW